MKALLLFLLGTASLSVLRAEQPPGSLDLLAGEWDIFTVAGQPAGSSTIQVQAKNAVVYEVRRNREGRETPMWFVNSEAAGGWVQLILGFNGLVRESLPVSPRGQVPVVMAGRFSSADGSISDFRLTIAPRSADEVHRKLEISRDQGATWAVLFEQFYRRRLAAP